MHTSSRARAAQLSNLALSLSGGVGSSDARPLAAHRDLFAQAQRDGELDRVMIAHVRRRIRIRLDVRFLHQLPHCRVVEDAVLVGASSREPARVTPTVSRMATFALCSTCGDRSADVIELMRLANSRVNCIGDDLSSFGAWPAGPLRRTLMLARSRRSSELFRCAQYDKRIGGIGALRRHKKWIDLDFGYARAMVGDQPRQP